MSGLPAPGGTASVAAPPGATVWLTGLPGAGKTTLARAVQARLRSSGRTAVVIDGDELRRGLCSDLGFAPSDRAENARRAAHVAALLAESGVVALVALVSPFAVDRARARHLHERLGLAFVETWVNRPLADCERTDAKGLYARARAGRLPGLTGLDGLYQQPRSPEVEIRPEAEPLDQSVERVLARLSTRSNTTWGTAGRPDSSRPAGDAAGAAGGFAALRDAVLADPSAQERLRPARDWDDFVGAAAALAAERGIRLDRRDLELAAMAARRAQGRRGI